MDKKINKILEKCIILLEKGYSVKYCLLKYKKHRDELEGYLQNLEDLNKIIPLELEEDYLRNNLNSIYERLDNEVVELKPETKFRRPLILKPAIIFISVFLVLIFYFSGIIYASQGSIPGNTLYPVKKSVEGVKIKTYPESIKGPLHYQLLKSRIYEATALINNSDNNDSIIGDLIEEINYEFSQIKKYSYFGNESEDELLKIIKLIELKYRERLEELEENQDEDSYNNNQDEELPQEPINNETEKSDENDSDSETNIKEEDIELDDGESNYIDDSSNDGTEINEEDKPEEDEPEEDKPGEDESEEDKPEDDEPE